MGYSLWGGKELYMTEHTRVHTHTHTGTSVEGDGSSDVCQAGFIWFTRTKLLRGWGPPGSRGAVTQNTDNTVHTVRTVFLDLFEYD